MIIDCAGCQLRDLACGDCVVTVLLGPPSGLGSAEQQALAVLADGGLVPPLRMVPNPTQPPRGAPGRAESAGGAVPGTATA